MTAQKARLTVSTRAVMPQRVNKPAKRQPRTQPRDRRGWLYEERDHKRRGPLRGVQR